jgi:hypothetical protein
MDPVGHKLLQIAKGELGYAEKASGYTKYGDWYGKHVDKSSAYKTAPWCDMFLAWAADKAGVQDWAGEFASTPAHASWFQKHHAWGHKAEPGAIVFFSFSGGKSIGDIEHVGIVEKVDGGTLHTIEANHNNQLLRATREVSQVVGFGYPAKVKVKGKPVPGTEHKYAPKHSAPPPPAERIAAESPHKAMETATHSAPDAPPAQPISQEAALTGLLAVMVFGTVTLAIAKSKVKVPMPALNVRVRKHGKHHRTPVTLPADVTPADLEVADLGTVVMPIVSAAAAAEAEDREFWGKIAELEEDQELAFWNSMHSAISQSSPEWAGSTAG